MVVVPAVLAGVCVLGLILLAVFVGVYTLTYRVLELIAERRDAAWLTDGRDGPEGRFPLVSGLVGLAAVVLTLILARIMFAKLDSVDLWNGLTIIGLLLGLPASWLFWEWVNKPGKARRVTPNITDRRPVKPLKEPSKETSEQQARQAEEQRKKLEERELEARRADSQARLKAAAAQKARIKAVYADLCALVELPEKKSCQRAALMARFMNRLFKMADIPVKKPFKWRLASSEGKPGYIEGEVWMAGYLYFVSLGWRSEPVQAKEMALYLQRLSKGGYIAGMFLSNTAFSPAAVSACQAGDSTRLVVLCELSEIVTLLERSGSLQDLFRDKTVETHA